jgi:hypothetical protein
MDRPVNSNLQGLLYATLVLLLLNLWMFSPVLDQLTTHLIGDPQTDTIRGAWGLNHLHKSIFAFQSPWDTTRINFPEGVQILVLPLASGSLLSPLGWLGPGLAWNLTMMILVLASGVSTAWLTKVMSDGWIPGVVAGAAVMGQPMLHQAIADGTAEHVALWAVPLFIGATWIALHEQSPRWGVGAGLFSIVVALDSPYHGLYALIIGLCVLPWAIRMVRGREKDFLLALTAMFVAAGIGISFVIYLYGRFEGGPIDGPGIATLQKTNATDLRLWWRHLSPLLDTRDLSRPPTLIPTPLLVGSLILGLLGGRKSWPWMIAGMLMVGLSFGLRPRTAELLGSWLGSPVGSLSELMMTINQWIYGLPIAGEIRFPRRWLVPASIALSTGAGIGLQTIFLRWVRSKLAQIVIGGCLAVAVLAIGINVSRLHQPFPSHQLQAAEFTTTIADAEMSGPVLLLPAFRSVKAGATREELPVFANLDQNLASADDLYLQLLHQQSMVSYPSLQTLMAHDAAPSIQRLLRDWSDLSHTKLGRRGIPPSAIDSGAQVERDRGLRVLRQAGLRWIAIDLGAYEEEGLAHLLSQLANKIETTQSFEEGDGVMLLRIRPPPSFASTSD